MGPNHLRSGQPGAPPAALLLLLARAPPARLLPPWPPLLSALERPGPLPALLPLALLLPVPLLPDPSRCCWKGEGPRTDPELLLVFDQPDGALVLLLEPKVGPGLLLLKVPVLPAAPGGLLLLENPLPVPEPVLAPTVGSPRGRWGFRLLPEPSGPLLLLLPLPVLVPAGPCGALPALLLGPAR